MNTEQIDVTPYVNPHEAPMTVACAWCGLVLTEGSATVSHGICPTCVEGWDAPLDAKSYFDPREAPVATSAPGPTVFYSPRADAQAALLTRAEAMR